MNRGRVGRCARRGVRARDGGQEEIPGSWRERRRREEWAHALVRLPGPGEGPLDHLLEEGRWREVAPDTEAGEELAMFLSAVTGVYFFPSREWVRLFGRLAQRLGSRRVLEAGAGRGYLAAALGPQLRRAGIAYRAIDTFAGEYNPGVAAHPLVQAGDAFREAGRWRPDLVLYAWPPPGQSLAPLCRQPGVRYVVVAGEAGGGCTGDPEDWRRFRHHEARLLSRYGLGRTGRRRQAVTIFYGAGHERFQERV